VIPQAVYELRVRSFADGDGDGCGDFAGLRRRLPYLRRLGVDWLWLLPIHPSPLKDDGYDVSDYFAVHPDYGTMADFRSFLAEAHRLGLRVMLDLVLNHTSDQHAWFQQARAPRSPCGKENILPRRDWYVWSRTDRKYAGVPVVFRDYEKSNWAWDPRAEAYYWHRFFSSQPDLNYENPRVRRAMLGVADYWLGLGVDGFRLDAVSFLFEQEGTLCKHLPRTHSYLRALRREIDRRHPGRLLLAEAFGRLPVVQPYFGGGKECHLAFNFELNEELFLALAFADGRRIARCVERTPAPPAGCAWATFLRSHDEMGLGALAPKEFGRMVEYYAPHSRQRLHGHIRRRLAPMLGNDRRRIELLHALLLSLPGVPVLYYGDEIGLQDDPSLPDRYGLRTMMDWREAERQEAEPGSLLSWLKRALRLRSASEALSRGSMRLLDTRDKAVLAFCRERGGENVAVVANLSGSEKRFGLKARLGPPARAAVREAEDLHSLKPVRLDRLRLEPYGCLWLKLSRTRPSFSSP